MSIIWTAIFFLLCFELFLLAVLCAPFPWGVRKNIARFLRENQIAKKFKVSMYYLMVAIALAVVEAITTIRYLEEKQEAAVGEAGPEGLGSAMNLQLIRSQRFRAQRNMYLAGFVLTLLFAINRIIFLTTSESTLRDEIKRLNDEKAVMLASASKKDSEEEEVTATEGPGLPAEESATTLTAEEKKSQ